MEPGQQFQIEGLQNKLNSFDWSQIDQQLGLLPHNPIYQVMINDKQTQKYYLRLRVILQNQEYQGSQMALALSTFLLKFSTNNYYALMLRRQHVLRQLQQIESSLQIQTSSHWQQNQQSTPKIQDLLIRKTQTIQNQLRFMKNLLQDNAKQYHVWTYKKDLIYMALRDAYSQQSHLYTQAVSEELKEFYQDMKQYVCLGQNRFIFGLLVQDSRNYHVWDYRFWLVTYLRNFRQQFEWMDKLVLGDNEQKQKQSKTQLMNMLRQQGFSANQLKINWLNVNSLWSHRFNLIKYQKTRSNNSPSLNQNGNFDFQSVFDRQIQLVVQLVRNNRQNQCLWNYLNGLIKLGQHYDQTDLVQKAINSINTKLFNIITNTATQVHINTLNRFELIFYNKIIRTAATIQTTNKRELEQSIIQRLRTIDPTRIKYYDYLLRREIQTGGQ